MKVKIGNKIYDSNEQPILLILDDLEKEQISSMRDQTKFCSFPEGSSISLIEKFMDIK